MSASPNRPPESRNAAVELVFVLDAIPALVSYIDADERYQFNNRAYYEWFGRTAEELRGRQLRDILGPDAYGAIKPHLESVLRGQRVDFETLARLAGSEPREIHATYVPDTAPDGHVRGFVAIVQDISETARAAREVRTADARLSLAKQPDGRKTKN